MGNKALKYTAGLIGLYLVVAYASGFGKAFTATTDGAGNVIKKLQARG